MLVVNDKTRPFAYLPDDDLRLQLLSERRDMAFDFTIYNDSSNFAYRKTNITICVQVRKYDKLYRESINR